MVARESKGASPATPPDDSLAAIRDAFGCDEQLASTILAVARAGRMLRASVLWPLPGRDETTLLTSGRAAEIAYGREGAVLVLYSIAAGEFYGSLLGGGAEQGDTRIEALIDSTGVHFSSAALVRLMESYSNVALALTRQMARRIEAMRQRMVETALLSATGRIAAELLRRARASSDGTIRPLPVFSELAVEVQTSRETVSRAISQWERRGLVKRVEGGLQVDSPHRLEELVY